MTEKLYDKDSHLKEFSATVISCEKGDSMYAVCLDKTAFFPEGGGQSSDTGSIGDVQVTDVQIENGVIYHYTSMPVSVGNTVSCRIDWEKRFRKMQNHSGEHIISGIVHKLFGFDNVGFHLGEEMTVDFDGELNSEQLLYVESLANEAVYKNVKFTAYYPSADELDTLSYRSKLDLHENVRIVEIEGYDTCACCAPHVNFSGEIGIIKILDCVRLRGGVRLLVKCGSDAINDYNIKYQNVLKISNLLSVKQHETAEAVKKLSEQNNNLKFEAAQLKKRLIACIAENFHPDTEVTTVLEDGLDIKETQLLSDALFKKCGGIRAVFSGQNDSLYFAICGEEKALDSFFILFKSTFKVRGGGRNGMVQGTVQTDFDSIRHFFTENKAFNLASEMV